MGLVLLSSSSSILLSLTFLVFFSFWDYGDDFAEASACVASFPGVFDLGVQTGPDFVFVVLEVGHEVVPCCGGAEGFD